MPTEEATAAPEPDRPPEQTAGPAEQDQPAQQPATTPPAETVSADQPPTTGLIPLNTPASEAEDERRTLAEMFAGMPVGGKIGLVAVLAIMLTLALVIAFLPAGGRDEAADATATAVAGSLTLTALPTPTPIGTETPRIYIIEESPVPTETPNATSTPGVYVVKAGDTLNSIARQYGVTVQEIATANGLFNVNAISVGQELIIPTPGPGTAVPPQTTGPGAPTTPVATPAAAGPVATLPALVITGASGAQEVALRIAAGPDYQAITMLSRGTIASLVAKTPDGLWYLIQLEDGYTRGWIPANSAGLIYPADPANIPTTPQP